MTDTTISAHKLNKLTPKNIQITITHGNCDNPFTNVELPIDPTIYVLMLKLTSAHKFREMLPLQLTVNDKGTVINAKPSTFYIEQHPNTKENTTK
jgi:hypothetical protein